MENHPRVRSEGGVFEGHTKESGTGAQRVEGGLV